jgi:hypothetical protein
MTDSPPWILLEDAWRAQPTAGPNLAELRRRVDRQTSWLRWLSRLEVGVTVVLTGWAALVARSLPESQRWGWLAAVLLHTAVVVAFTAWNRRGIWRPLGNSTREYLSLALERCRRRRRTAGFLVALLGVEAVGLLVWLASRAEGFRRPVLSAVVVAAMLVTAAISVWFRRRWGEELARLEELWRVVFEADREPSREAADLLPKN